MFKNLIIYRLAPGLGPNLDLDTVEQSMSKSRFVECGPTQERASGWVEPRGEAHGPLVESIGGQWIIKFQTETKAVPGAVLARKAKEVALHIEQTTGRKPGRKETKEIKEELKLTLLPNSFSKMGASLVWIDKEAGLLVIDAGSQSRADEVVTGLVKSIDGFSVALLDTQQSPVSAMAEWLTGDHADVWVDHNFSIGNECELKAGDESKSVVRYGRHPLDTEEVKQHIAQGKLPTKLALSWDDRVSFVLTEGMQLKKISFLDVVFEGKSADDGGFDADVAIMTGELSKMLPDLIEALGGEAQRPEVTEGTAAPVGDEQDPLYDEAVKLVRESGKGSVSYVQRHLRIGYYRAACLLEAMEKAGVLSTMNSSGVRSVIGGAA